VALTSPNVLPIIGRPSFCRWPSNRFSCHC
jgi:hypothetical protein